MPNESPAELPDLATMGPGELFNFLWATKYAPAIASTIEEEKSRRTDAFADGVSFEVCGEHLRLMTPRDMLYLDGFENAFMVSGVPTLADLQFFLWTLNVLNDPSRPLRNGWRRGRAMQRIAQRISWFDDDVSEVYRYMDRLWLESPADEPANAEGKRETPKPAGTYCLAPLMVSVAGAMGAIDPMSGRLLADTPIPRLLQYQRSINERKTGEAAATSFDSARSHCLEEVNAIMAARRAKPEAA